jgi:Bax protein
LSQAAIESAWGTSRFFLEANNPFGLWSFNSKQERITAESTRNGKKVYLRKFNNMDQAIDAYLTTLSTGPYNEFRKQRLKTQDPYVLVNYLIDYSERREAYVEEVVSVIKGNDLTKYDTYMISPKYIKH